MRADPASGDEARIDPASVQTLPELAAALDRLRGTRSYAQLDRAARARGRRLAASTLSNLLNSTSVPMRDTMVTFLTACGLDEEAEVPWLAAWERVATAHLRHPAGAVRVREARPRLLGVHAAIQAAGAAGELPPYVPRELDADLRTVLNAAGRDGGFVLLVGGSSVGKTRALVEAVRAVLPEWWLVHPADIGEIREFALAPIPRTVMWLDELQRYLNQPGGLPAGLVRALIAAGVVVAATVWPDEYLVRVASRQPGQPDPYANDRDLLGIAEMVAVPETFSAAERRCAEALATDRRIRVALDTPDAGFTQVLAAGPELVRWWEQAPADQSYGKAVITAALDALRVGATAPLTRDYLEAAAPGYLTPAAQASAPPDWLDQGLAYATTRLHGAAATLTPVPAGMGQIAGYTVADYLHQHALRARRTTPLPDIVWQALADHHHPDDTMRLAHSAEDRGRPAEAECLYRQAIEAGDTSVADHLAWLLAGQGRVEELGQRADDDGWAADVLANLLVDQGRIEELRQRADAGDGSAADRLADLLIKQGRVDEAIAALSQPGVTDDWRAAERLADLLATAGRVEDAITVLRQAVDGGEWLLTRPLSRLLAEQGHVEELRRRADSNSPANVFAAASLADLLAKLGRVEELQERADAGDGAAANRLAGLLAEQGHLDDAIMALWQLADAGDGAAAYRLADLLMEQGRIDDVITIMRGPADAGDLTAANWLADLLAKRGRVEDLRERADAGDGLAASRLADLLAGQGRVEELRQRADTGDTHAGNRLADLLAGQGRVEELRQRADTGDALAANRLADLLAGQGRIDDAITVLQQPTIAGDLTAGDRLSDLLVQQGRLDDLADEVAAGTYGAAERFAAFGGDSGQSEPERQDS